MATASFHSHDEPQRWRDVADQLYSPAFRDTFDYRRATCLVAVADAAPRLQGALLAVGLKPNFVYQIKLEAPTDSPAFDAVAACGRYWQEEWLGALWGQGLNLNRKGDGRRPSPNDLLWRERVTVTAAGSPTGRRYRFRAYWLLGWFVTDARGGAWASFADGDSYHALFRVDQRPPQPADCPPRGVVCRADPASSPAYDTALPPREVQLYAEWERLPAGGQRLPAGDYQLDLVVSEDGLHGSGGEFGGGWATVLQLPLRVSIAPTPAD
ncbi:MAG: hypothetical protein IT204_23395 [Fimbriimonadaceae bacterium]|nr:hypothetical protein [Fimbriimonadaceae bacterium]